MFEQNWWYQSATATWCTDGIKIPFFSHDHVLHFRGYHLLIHNLSAETMLSFCIVTFSFPVSFQHTFMLFLVVQRALLQLGQQIASKAERIEREEANEYIFVGSFVQD